MSNTQPLLSSKDFSSSLTVAKVYLASRNVDYAKFSSEVLDSIARSVRHDFENGYSMVEARDGTIAFIDSDCGGAKLFPTWEQFAAYFLAKFW